MLISEKGKCFHVFGCILKNFPENIFWCLEKKKENTNPEKHKPQPRFSPATNPVRRPRRRSRSNNANFLSRRRRDLPHSPSPAGSSSLAYIRDLAIDASRDRAVDCDLDPVRSHEGEITINGTISRWRDHDQRKLECLPVRSRSSDCAGSRVRVLSLSLCKIFQKYFEGKIEV